MILNISVSIEQSIRHFPVYDSWWQIMLMIGYLVSIKKVTAKSECTALKSPRYLLEIT